MDYSLHPVKVLPFWKRLIYWLGYTYLIPVLNIYITQALWLLGLYTIIKYRKDKILRRKKLVTLLYIFGWIAILQIIILVILFYYEGVL